MGSFYELHEKCLISTRSTIKLVLSLSQALCLWIFLIRKEKQKHHTNSISELPIWNPIKSLKMIKLILLKKFIWQHRTLLPSSQRLWVITNSRLFFYSQAWENTKRQTKSRENQGVILRMWKFFSNFTHKYITFRKLSPFLSSVSLFSLFSSLFDLMEFY